MDGDRAEIGVGWWSTRGGRERVLNGGGGGVGIAGKKNRADRGSNAVVMSGAIRGEEERTSSKL